MTSLTIKKALQGHAEKKLFPLDEVDIMRLIQGCSPHPSVFDHELIKPCGHLEIGETNHWVWDMDHVACQSLSVKWEIYQVVKNSWR